MKILVYKFLLHSCTPFIVALGIWDVLRVLIAVFFYSGMDNNIEVTAIKLIFGSRVMKIEWSHRLPEVASVKTWSTSVNSKFLISTLHSVFQTIVEKWM